MLSACLALSLHLLPGDWNGLHPCVRYERDGWVAGAFLNSEGRLSLSVGHKWQTGPWFTEAGLATGYSGGAVVPMVRGGYDFGHVRAFVAPAATVKREVGLVVGLEFQIGD